VQQWCRLTITPNDKGVGIFISHVMCELNCGITAALEDLFAVAKMTSCHCNILPI